MFGISSANLIVILLIALIVLGPKNLPKVANSIGKAMGEFRRASTDFQRSLNTEIAMEEHKEKQRQSETRNAEPTVTASTEGKDESGSGQQPE